MNIENITNELNVNKAHTSNPDFSIILVCWNNKAYLEPCLESIYQGQIIHSFEIVVIDNGSTDGSQAMLAEKFPDVLLIQNDHNVGLGKASNQGIEATRGRYVLLLNNDTVVNGASFDRLVDILDKNDKAGAAGGFLLNPDGSIQSGYNHFSTLREEFLIATRIGELVSPGYPAVNSAGTRKEVDWISSACLLVRRSALDQIGLLDEEYFIYGDETDLQYRLHNAGWKVIFEPEATIIHYGGRSMNRWSRRKMVYRGKMLFYQKNYGAMHTGLLRILLGFISFLKLLPWAFTYLLPAWRERARKELSSNVEVIQLCIKLT